MKLQTMLRDTERETLKKDISKTISMLKESGDDENTIFNLLKKNYQDDFSDEKIRQFIDETK